jgi:hypothetical protein
LQAIVALVKNIVLVRGAFVNGSAWKPVFEILVKHGYHVSVAEQPLTTFGDDVTAVKRVLAMQESPTLHRHDDDARRCGRSSCPRRVLPGF